MYNEKGDYTIEVCFSPLSWPLFAKPGSTVIIVDIFRATTAICTALHHGVRSIIPVAEISESEDYKKRGFIIAGERDGQKFDCADIGNSPYHFLNPDLAGKTIVMNTTNGTQAIKAASTLGNVVVIGSFLNLDAIARFVALQKKPVLIFCAGWKSRFSLEDTIFAGALAYNLISSINDGFHTICDSTIASIDLWHSAMSNPLEYIQKAAHRHRLRKMGLDDILEFSFNMNYTSVVPMLQGYELVAADI